MHEYEDLRKMEKKIEKLEDWKSQHLEGSHGAINGFMDSVIATTEELEQKIEFFKEKMLPHSHDKIDTIEAVLIKFITKYKDYVPQQWEWIVPLLKQLEGEPLLEKVDEIEKHANAVLELFKEEQEAEPVYDETPWECPFCHITVHNGYFIHINCYNMLKAQIPKLIAEFLEDLEKINQCYEHQQDIEKLKEKWERKRDES